MSRILINPLNIPYQFQHYNKQASRESADPTLIYFKGRYYLFASMSGGFFFPMTCFIGTGTKTGS